MGRTETAMRDLLGRVFLALGMVQVGPGATLVLLMIYLMARGTTRDIDRLTIAVAGHPDCWGAYFLLLGTMMRGRSRIRTAIAAVLGLLQTAIATWLITIALRYDARAARASPLVIAMAVVLLIPPLLSLFSLVRPDPQGRDFGS